MDQLNALAKSLLVGAFLIFVMIVIGGATRLTGSGLSIVEWQPLVGILPPFNQDDWQQLFRLYQQSPEFQKVNMGMELEGFKEIFWLEYIHRVWGRLLGLYFAALTLWAFLKPQLRPYGLPILGLWLLGGLQGVVGWYMVKSGLIYDPHVSPYRLAFHLLLGFTTLGLSFWMGVKLLVPAHEPVRRNLIPGLALILLTIFYGALVAGHKAGLVYNMFPYMGGALVPEEFLHMSPWFKDILENPVTVQFIHRALAMSTLVYFLGLSLRYGGFYWHLFAAVSLQATVGILTLLYQVPVVLGVIHQAVAALMILSVVFSLHKRRHTGEGLALKPLPECAASR